MKHVREKTIFEVSPTFQVLPDDWVGSLVGATPSVLNLRTWKFVNTTPVTVTQFLDGAEAQRIHVLGDGNTTIQNNAIIKTNNSADKLLEVDKVYCFTYINSLWIEDSGDVPTIPSVVGFENIVRLTADNPAVAAGTSASVVTTPILGQSANVDEEWDIEWILYILLSVATDILVFKVFSDAGTLIGRASIIGQEGPPDTGAGVAKFIGIASNVITPASAQCPGNPGSTVKPTTVFVRAQGKQTVANGVIRIGIRATDFAGASSGTATIIARSQMIATRLA